MMKLLKRQHEMETSISTIRIENGYVYFDGGNLKGRKVFAERKEVSGFQNGQRVKVTYNPFSRGAFWELLKVEAVSVCYEVWYQWKELVDVEGKERLLNVQRDPYEHENSIGEMLFSSTDEAFQALDEWDCRQEFIDDKWQLVKVTYEVLPETH